MKKILCALLICLLITGCTNSNFSGEVKISLDNQDFDLWKAQGIDETITYDGELLSNKTFSIGFWIKPTTNKAGTALYTIGDENNYVQLVTSGSTDSQDGTTYSGISLVSKTIGNEDWVVAEGNKTLQTGRFNYVVTQFDNGSATIYLNGEKVAEGKLKLGYSKNLLQFGRDSVYGINHEDGFVSQLMIGSSLLSDEKILKNYESQYSNVLLDSITFTNMDDVINAPWLVDVTVDDVPVTWVSSNPDVMSVYAKLNPVKEDTVVTMNATIDVNGVKSSKDFDFTVKALTNATMLNRDLIECDASIQKVIHDGFELPTQFTNNSVATWSIVKGNATIEDQHIIKNTDNEKEPITVQVVLNNQSETITKTYDLVLLDKVAGYVLSYFNGELGEETGKLAISKDALHWEDLNQGESIITSELGNGRIRDPFITRDKNGNFVVLATEGFDNPYIYIMNSNDLIDFSDQQLVRVAYFDEAMQMSGKRAWAPEMMYDMETDQYYIYFSDPGDKELVGHIYAVNTKDFNEFSYPYSYYNPGYNVIDGTILPLDGKYWMFYKDERKAAQTIFFASTNKLSNGFGLAYDDRFIFDQKYIEGPFVTKVDDGYVLYVDYYPKGTFHVAKFTTLGKEMDFEWLDETEYNLPNEDVRHGSIIPVTQKELDKIINNYK
ncbi:LamG-like jellyroll fold domain-containing protein [Anaerorhabdus sp.]|uniref:LamG-like jellyroll fold domain-containing protein n=1 Tax=Anaerorhabdus sp. TaxID=1872524 RepID=UPI002FC5A910